ncbi:MAG TPA: DUF4056 domain-containing protein [Anaerohalosphaeraceae bacterium]|nr:DUF4056 domain-containing protein [Anaerohalosphaeraceae bacterium]
MKTSTSHKKFRLSIQLMVLLAMLLEAGCAGPRQPRRRLGAFFGAPGGMTFLEPDRLGRHHYQSSSGEKVGMVYTCRGGFIDIGHVREAADRTAYLQQILYSALLEGKTQISYHIIEPSHYTALITYPPGWHTFPEEKKKALAFETSVRMAQTFTHWSLVWHEILTWFGFASSGIFSEHISAFSWEDTYSDLLGISLAGYVLRSEQPYNKGMTEALQRALAHLEVQPASVAKEAAHQIEGNWYSGGFYFFVEMKKRNFSTGLGFRPVVPLLVPGICPDAVPSPLPAPLLSSPTPEGFEADLLIYPVETERWKIYHILNLEPEMPIRPTLHFPPLLEEIRSQAQPQSRSGLSTRNSASG